LFAQYLKLVIVYSAIVCQTGLFINPAKGIMDGLQRSVSQLAFIIFAFDIIFPTDANKITTVEIHNTNKIDEKYKSKKVALSYNLLMYIVDCCSIH